MDHKDALPFLPPHPAPSAVPPPHPAPPAVPPGLAAAIASLSPTPMSTHNSLTSVPGSTAAPPDTVQHAVAAALDSADKAAAVAEHIGVSPEVFGDSAAFLGNLNVAAHGAAALSDFAQGDYDSAARESGDTAIAAIGVATEGGFTVLETANDIDAHAHGTPDLSETVNSALQTVGNVLGDATSFLVGDTFYPVPHFDEDFTDALKDIQTLHQDLHPDKPDMPDNPDGGLGLPAGGTPDTVLPFETQGHPAGEPAILYTGPEGIPTGEPAILYTGPEGIPTGEPAVVHLDDIIDALDGGLPPGGSYTAVSDPGASDGGDLHPADVHVSDPGASGGGDLHAADVHVSDPGASDGGDLHPADVHVSDPGASGGGDLHPADVHVSDPGASGGGDLHAADVHVSDPGASDGGDLHAADVHVSDPGASGGGDLHAADVHVSDPGASGGGDLHAADVHVSDPGASGGGDLHAADIHGVDHQQSPDMHSDVHSDMHVH